MTTEFEIDEHGKRVPAPHRWESVRGTITRTIIESLSGKQTEVTEFRLQVQTADGNMRGQVVTVENHRLRKHPELYAITLNLLVRELGIWDPR